MSDKQRILMVCLGNICRSPLAEGIMRSKLNFTKFEVDSAGTYGGHVGEQPDNRSIEVARKNGLDITNQKCRKLTVDDFDRFDYIYVMDDSNFRDVTALAPTPEHANKVVKILDELFPGEGLDVPDPYYGGQQGFENVYKMLDQATDVIAKKLQG
ncbi:MAG: low molecular weight protein-tyrosine-phosphatase [Bacteroidota bacterium]|uniref:low molecular weight protein-tyrosine-phosphatase n=1 Tax=Nonlabens TaxID=363408 RepID=UPI000A20BBC3|nr:low molecular weight protein-tyrosine-phosphatase [Nonlabens tegetincola]ARN70568.1 protein-tyrosine-phosphatase [Nonlabens tegetincola]MEE2802669.1 low molecular weight protein-tyrosine-phosphatase [Bacteroidota bacterium]